MDQHGRRGRPARRTTSKACFVAPNEFQRARTLIAVPPRAGREYRVRLPGSVTDADVAVEALHVIENHGPEHIVGELEQSCEREGGANTGRLRLCFEAGLV